MSIDIRIFTKKGTKCHRITIGDSPVSQSVCWLDYTIEDWESDSPAYAEVVYARHIWSFYTYKRFRNRGIKIRH